MSRTPNITGAVTVQLGEQLSFEGPMTLKFLGPFLKATVVHEEHVNCNKSETFHYSPLLEELP